MIAFEGVEHERGVVEQRPKIDPHRGHLARVGWLRYRLGRMDLIDHPLQPPTADRPLALIEGGGASPLSIGQRTIRQAFRDHGAVLLRGFAVDVAGFRQVAEQLCATSVHNESPNRARIDAASTIQSVDLGVDAFPLHPELSREPWRPDACLFACLSPPASGGETTLCDGVAIVERLPDQVRAAMHARRLLYVQPATTELLEFWLGTRTPDDGLLAAPPPTCPYFFRRTRGGIVRGFARPLLDRPMFDDRPAFANFLLFARDFLGLANFPCLDDGSPVPAPWLDAVRTAAAAATYAVEWREGDIVILDNSRFMHGRRAIADPRQRRIASFFGYIDFAPPNPHDSIDPPWRRGEFRPPDARR